MGEHDESELYPRSRAELLAIAHEADVLLATAHECYIVGELSDDEYDRIAGVAMGVRLIASELRREGFV